MEKNLSQLKAEYNNITVPEEARERILSGVRRAKREQKVVRFPVGARVAVGVAAAFAVCFISVNASGEVADAAAKLPVIGKFFEVITVKEFKDEAAVAQVPRITDTDSLAAQEVNVSSDAYIEAALKQFEQDRILAGTDRMSLDMGYSVLTDNDKYFSLDIVGTDTEAGGYEFHRFYTIDKDSDRVLRLKDLYADGEDYVSLISAEIIRQMNDSDVEYFVGVENGGFEQISEDQNFYIDEAGNIVICFDEYEVGPGSIGSPQFVIKR